MSLKHEYFKSRNNDLSIANNSSSNREELAKREVLTFQNLCRIKGFDPKLDGTTFLDLGSGDQFLRRAVDGTNYIPPDIVDYGAIKK